MKAKLFLLLVLFGCLLVPLASAQSVPAVVKPQPDGPIQITSSECSPGQAGGVRCSARVVVGQEGLWNAYGLKWKLTFENQRSITLSRVVDASLLKEVGGGAFKPGEVSEEQTGGFGLRAPDGKDLRLSGVEVEVEFAVPVVGRTWGNTKSVHYAELMARRQGFSQALAYLRSVYTKEGAEGILRVLRTP